MIDFLFSIFSFNVDDFVAELFSFICNIKEKMFDLNEKVQKITDGKIGTVKNIINTNTGKRYQIHFDNGESPYISEEILIHYNEIKTPTALFESQIFYGVESFKRIMSFQRLMGDLTNMFYSMNNSYTEYLPHQFLPVTKFLQAPEERILIADEVGLGKTIEAMYIWMELKARRNAKRLLVICPAALREKWKKDMQNLFGIYPDIIKADEFLQVFENIKTNRNKEQFAYICSLESIRAKKTDGINKVSQLNREFENFAADFSEDL